MNLVEIEKQFGLGNALRFEKAPGGLARVVVSTPLGSGVIYLQGAHVAEWTPAGDSAVLFISSRSGFTEGKAIRGGIPVIFPWFGPRSDGRTGPAHGLARTALWSVDETRLTGDGGVGITLSLGSDEATRVLGYDEFRVRLSVVMGRRLRLELQVRNESAESMRFEEALHSYFAVGSVHDTGITGLEGTEYIDKTDGAARKRQGDKPVHFAKETDQVHVNSPGACIIHDRAGKRRITVEKAGSASTIVWNPWSEKAGAMADMGQDEWLRMVCVESGNAAENAIVLEPHTSHTLAVTISVESGTD